MAWNYQGLLQAFHFQCRQCHLSITLALFVWRVCLCWIAPRLNDFKLTSEVCCICCTSWCSSSEKKKSAACQSWNWKQRWPALLFASVHGKWCVESTSWWSECLTDSWWDGDEISQANWLNKSYKMIQSFDRVTYLDNRRDSSFSNTLLII